MNDQFSLLTRLPQRFGFNSRGLKSIGLIFSSADVRRSWGEFYQIWRLITTNPASIWSWASLSVGESWWTQDLYSKSINCFTIWSKVKFTRGENIYLERISREIRGIVAHDADFTPCDFNHPIARNWWDLGPWHGFPSVWFQPSDRAKLVRSWPMTRIPLRVISTVRS